MVASTRESRKDEAAQALANMATGRTPPPPQVVKIVREPTNARAYFDAASSDRLTQNHFANSSIADINAIVRSDLPTMRKWCRFEGLNNSYAKGIIETLANDIVGRGPRLQIESPPGDPTAKTGVQRIEDAWADWADNCDADGRLSFGEMLSLAVKQCPTAGESMMVMVNDSEAKRRNKVSLRLRLIEGDRVTTPYGLFRQPNVRDGIRFTKSGRPTHYIIMKRHPGDTSTLGMTNPAAYDEVPADKVVHIMRPDRPGQHRGIPWLAAALIPLAHLRRYTLATVAAAETAASISGVIHTNVPGFDIKAKEAFDNVEVPHNSLVTLPPGYEIQAFEPRQPTATYPTFKSEMLDEIGRGISMPHNVVAGNSSGYNYASGRLDWQTYFRMIRTDQSWLGRHCSHVFAAWFAEYILTTRIIPITGRISKPASRWYWPGHEHVDPAKEANAQRIKLNSLTTTLEDEYAAKGQDWRRKIDQIADERTYLAEKGLTIEEAAPAIASVETESSTEEAAETAAEETNNETAASAAA